MAQCRAVREKAAKRPVYADREGRSDVKLSLSDHFTYGRLLRFTLPSIIMMVFTSIYSVVDGYFVSNFAGKTSLAAVNLVFPITMMLGAAGLMLGSGGGALIAKTLGEKEEERAQKIFSLFVVFGILLGGALMLTGYAIMGPVIRSMGAEGELYEDSLRYARILLAAIPALTSQFMFQSFFIAAGRPQTGLLVTVVSGLTNMALDYLLVGVAGFGLEGAGWATAASQIIGGCVPILYFLRPNASTLRLVRPVWNGRAVKQACTNGISELLSNISMNIVAMLFNAQLLHIAGQNGVAAYSVLLYVNFVFVSTFVGFSVGLNPVVGYAYGAQNREELRSLRKKSLIIIVCFAAAMTAFAELAGTAIATSFVGYDPELLEMTHRGFEIYSLSYLFVGFPIFGSAFFTGLNNGPVSALISVSRTLVFQVACILILPDLLGVDGVWLSVVVAEWLSTIVTFVLLRKFRTRYGYA